MNSLIETMKGWLLVFLVVMSGVLSIGLWNNAPSVEAIDNAGNIPNPAFGLKKSVEQVLLPVQIEARVTDKRLVILPPLTQQYDKAWEELRKVGVGELALVADPAALLQVIQASVHVQYKFGMDLNQEQVYQMIHMTDSSVFRMQINSVTVYRDASGAGKIVLSDDKGPIFEGKIGNSPLFDQLPQWAGLPSYKQFHGATGTFAVPEEKMKVPMQTFERMSIPSETLARSFFVDPNLTRKIQERDGSLILTDGNRTVQILSPTKNVRYSSTVPHERTPESANSDSSFQRSVSFINEHGGLQAPYIGKLVASWAADRREYEFIEYRNGWPVYAGLTGIHIAVAGNEVIEMNRNTLFLGMQVKEQEVEIEPPQKLLGPGIRNLYLAYAPKAVENNRIQLVPVWVAEKLAGETVTYDALTGAVWQDTGEWSHGLE